MSYTFDDHGRPKQKITTQTNKTPNQTQVEVGQFPTQAIPVIFIPGIMGSPLRSLGNGNTHSEDNQWAWFPDDPTGWVAGIGGKGFSDLDASQRRALLNPAKTVELKPEDKDFDDKVKKEIQKKLNFNFSYFGKEKIPIFSIDEAIRRGWGTVYWEGYGTLLAYLEKNLRYITYSGDPYSKEILDKGKSFYIAPPIEDAFTELINGKEKHFKQALSKFHPSVNVNNKTNYKDYIEELKPILKEGRQYHYPVFAAGFNWLKCIDQSAEDIYNRIQKIFNYVEKTLNFKCNNEVIVVTHSMGGLVGRALANNHRNLKIRGIVHSVQPCNGSATLFARMWAGWEGGKHWYSIVDNIAGASLAKTAAELIPILTQSPGAMELSPNQNYAAGWLRISESKTNKELLTIPQANSSGKSDPYTEIYLQKNSWWRLATPVEMDPKARTQEKQDDVWRDYEKVILAAKQFHEKLSTYYHPNSYLLYGNFNAYRTWGRVDLQVTPFKTEIVRVPVGSGVHYTVVETPKKVALSTPVPRKTVLEASREQIPARGGEVDLATKDGSQLMVELVNGKEAGDGTVPFNSANPWKATQNPWGANAAAADAMPSTVPSSIRHIFEFSNQAYEHSMSYAPDNVLNVTFFTLMNIIAKK